MDPTLESLPQAVVERRAWHRVSVARLKKLWNPWVCWIEQDEPITREEVQACLGRGEEARRYTPLWSRMIEQRTRISPAENRRRHIQKIAWFVRHAASVPIDLDVGCSALGYRSSCLVPDGNHRLAAAMFRGDEAIAARISGSDSDARALGLWNPNAYEIEWRRRCGIAPTPVEVPASPEAKARRPKRKP